MELDLVSKGKKTVVIELTDVRETTVHPLIDRLLGDEDVLLVTYKTGHPQLDKPRLTVKTQRVNPETAVKKAADSLTEEIKTLRKEFEKAVKGAKAKKAKVKKPKTGKAEKDGAEKPKTSKAKKETVKKPKASKAKKDKKTKKK